MTRLFADGFPGDLHKEVHALLDAIDEEDFGGRLKVRDATAKLTMIEGKFFLSITFVEASKGREWEITVSDDMTPMAFPQLVFREYEVKFLYPEQYGFDPEEHA